MQTFLGPFLAYPQQSGKVVDLIDQGQILVAFGVLNLVHPDGKDRSQRPILQAPLDHVFHRITDFLPGGLKRFGHLLPAQLPCPVRQELHVHFCQLMFPAAPWHLLHHHSALAAIYSSHAVEEKHQQAPERDELESSLFQMIVAGTPLVAARANRLRAAPRSYPYFDGFFVLREFCPLVDESRASMAVV